MKKNRKKIILLILAIALSIIVFNKISFHSLPKKVISSVNLGIEKTYIDNEFKLKITNTLYCPNRFEISSKDAEINNVLSEYSPFVINAKSDTTIVIKKMGDLTDKINVRMKWGDPDLPITSKKIQSLPYPKGISYQLLQGNNMGPTHNSTMSRYAYDFTMDIGDTVTSTQNGFIVNEVDGYKGWGYSDKWKPFGNQVMVYDTTTNLFTLYGHLKENGSLVDVGDYVEIGQPIALSGRTGQSPEEHLHYNVMIANKGEKFLKSYRLDSIGDYEVKSLKRYQKMENNRN